MTASAATGFYTGREGPDGKRTSLAIISPRYDTFFFMLSFLVPPAIISLYALNVAPVIVLLPLWSLTLDVPHLMQTLTRTVMDDEGRKLFGLHTLVTFLLLMSGALALIFTGNTFALWGVFLAYGPYHILMQHFGIMSFYRRRGGETDARDARLDRMVIMAIYAFYVAMTFRRILDFGPAGPTLSRLGDVFGPGIYTAGKQGALIVSGVLGAVLLVALVVWTAHIVRRRLAAGSLNRPRVLLMALTVANYATTLTLIHLAQRPMTAVFVAVVSSTAWHNVQYHGLVWHYNNKKFAKGGAQGSRALSWLSQDGRLWVYMLALWAAALVYGAISLQSGRLEAVLAPIFAFTFLHYHMDSVIWKTRKNQEVTGIFRFRRPGRTT